MSPHTQRFHILPRITKSCRGLAEASQWNYAGFEGNNFVTRCYVFSHIHTNALKNSSCVGQTSRRLLFLGIICAFPGFGMHPVLASLNINFSICSGIFLNQIKSASWMLRVPVYWLLDEEQQQASNKVKLAGYTFISQQERGEVSL